MFGSKPNPKPTLVEKVRTIENPLAAAAVPVTPAAIAKKGPTPPPYPQVAKALVPPSSALASPSKPICNKEELLGKKSINIAKSIYEEIIKHPAYIPYMYIRIGLLESEGKALYYCADSTDFTENSDSITRDKKIIPVTENIHFYITEDKWNEFKVQYEIKRILSKNSFTYDDITELHKYNVEFDKLDKSKFNNYINTIHELSDSKYRFLIKVNLIKREDYKLIETEGEDDYGPDDGRRHWKKNTYYKIKPEYSIVENLNQLGNMIEKGYVGDDLILFTDEYRTDNKTWHLDDDYYHAKKTDAETFPFIWRGTKELKVNKGFLRTTIYEKDEDSPPYKIGQILKKTEISGDEAGYLYVHGIYVDRIKPKIAHLTTWPSLPSSYYELLLKLDMIKPDEYKHIKITEQPSPYPASEITIVNRYDKIPTGSSAAVAASAGAARAGAGSGSAPLRGGKRRSKRTRHRKGKKPQRSRKNRR